jgi:hypothetical protein
MLETFSDTLAIMSPLIQWLATFRARFAGPSLTI